MKRKVAYLVSKSKLIIKEDQLPKLNEGQLEYPHILGHECSGEIFDVGENCEDLRPGDRVTVEPGVPCKSCEYCLKGQYNLCKTISFMSSAVRRPGGEGGMAEYIIRPASFVYRILPAISYQQAALIEPISVAIHAVEKSKIRPWQNAAILGCGPIAGCILQVLKAYGVNKVWMTDVMLERTEFMNRLGADQAYHVGDMDYQILKKLLWDKVDVVFDTTCNGDALNASMHWLKKGGTITLVGVPGGKREIDLQTAFTKELSLITSFRYANTYPSAISLIKDGKIHPERLISHVFTLDDAHKAMEMASSKRENVMKVMLEW